MRHLPRALQRLDQRASADPGLPPDALLPYRLPRTRLAHRLAPVFVPDVPEQLRGVAIRAKGPRDGDGALPRPLPRVRAAITLATAGARGHVLGGASQAMNAATERASVRRLPSSSRRRRRRASIPLAELARCSAWAACRSRARDVRVYITRPQASGERVSAGLSPTALTASVRTPTYAGTRRSYTRGRRSRTAMCAILDCNILCCTIRVAQSRVSRRHQQRPPRSGTIARACGPAAEDKYSRCSYRQIENGRRQKHEAAIPMAAPLRTRGPPSSPTREA